MGILGSLYPLLKLTHPITIADIGANPIDGAPPYAPLMKTGHTRIIGFEPQADALAQLNKMKGPNDLYLPHAVGDGKRHTLYHTLAPGMTSLLKPDAHILSMFHNFPRWGTVQGTEEIDTVRFDDIPGTEHIDYLKLDVQGGELLVLEHAVNRLKQVVVVQTEVEFLPMYENQPLFSDIDQFMRRQGFILHRMEPIQRRTLSPTPPFIGLNQWLWADAIYYRDLSKLDAMTNEQLLSLAIIAHDCYDSYDVVMYLLIEYDKRCGTPYSTQYRNVLSHTEGQISYERGSKQA